MGGPSRSPSNGAAAVPQDLSVAPLRVLLSWLERAARPPRRPSPLSDDVRDEDATGGAASRASRLPRLALPAAALRAAAPPPGAATEGHTTRTT
jgi:hypothetical protein